MGGLRDRAPQLDALFAEMESGARRQLEIEGFDTGAQRLRRSLDLRYRGQAFELNVALPEPVGPGASDAARPGAPWTRAPSSRRPRTRSTARTSPRTATRTAPPPSSSSTRASPPTAWCPKPAADRYRSAGASLDGALIERRRVWFAGAPVDCPVWERDRLPEGARLSGPAIVEEFGATSVLPPGWRAALDEPGNLRLEREAGA